VTQAKIKLSDKDRELLGDMAVVDDLDDYVMVDDADMDTPLYFGLSAVCTSTDHHSC
jgi:hypothetical protein